MTFDPIANTFNLPVPPCPFCGGKVHGNAISAPPFLYHCDGCKMAIPIDHYYAVCVGLSGSVQKYIDLYRETAQQLNEVRLATIPLLEALKR